MRHKTLFRLLIKFLGVWLTCLGIASAMSATSNLVAYVLTQPARSGVSYSYPYWMSYASSYTSALTHIGLGLYLFFGGKWIVDMAIPSNRPYCHECGYDLTGAAGDVCNECGTPFRGAVTSTHE